MIETLGIAGVGLIGGSIGLAAKSRGLALHVIGIGRNPERLQHAVELGAIDTFTTDFLDGAHRSDLLYLAAPVKTIIQHINLLKSMDDQDLIVTDGGSSKGAIMAASTNLPGRIRFVGGHPMAGSEEGGVGAASADLFDNATYVLTPVERTNAEALERVRSFAVELGANVLLTDPKSHDQAAATTSHLPHIIAGAFMRAASLAGPDVPSFAAGSFRDLTRVADSSPILWRDICATNRTAILKTLEDFKDALKMIESLISQENQEAELESWFEENRRIRSALAGTQEGKS